jgi:glycosyltransferase involved in cell wall biosynthesis
MSSSIVLTYPYALGVPGGSSLDCTRTALHLRGAGADVTVISVSALPQAGWRHRRPPVPQSERGDAREEELRDHGVEVIRVAPHPIHPWLDSLGVRRAFGALSARGKIDVALGYWQEAAGLPDFVTSRGAHFGMIATAPYEVFLRGPRLDAAELFREPGKLRSRPRFAATLLYRMLFRNRVLRWVPEQLRKAILERPLRRADLVFARSGHVRTELVKSLGVSGERILVIPCGLDPAWSEVPRSAAEPVSRLVYFGALTREKGVFDALSALGQLAKRLPNPWTLRIAGPGPVGPVLEAARTAQIAERVEVLGSLDPSALRQLLAWAQLALLPSHFESFGLAVAEAQAAGLPVVAWAQGGVAETIEDGRTGHLVPFGDIGDLARRVEACFEDPERTHAMGLAGRSRATKLFSWPRGAEQMLESLLRLRSRAAIR